MGKGGDPIFEDEKADASVKKLDTHRTNIIATNLVREHLKKAKVSKTKGGQFPLIKN